MVRWRAYSARRSGRREVQAADALVGLEHVADLLPGVVHVLFGVGLDHFGAEVAGTRKRGSRLRRCTQFVEFGAGVPSRLVSSAGSARASGRRAAR